MCHTNNARLAIVNEAYRSKDLAKVIKLLTAQPGDHCDLQTLHCPTKGQITDHFAIHSHVTAFFREWYNSPPDLDAAAQNLTTTPDWWKELLCLPEHSSTAPLLHPLSKIPKHLQQGLRKVCATKASPTIQAEIAAEIDRLITFDDFSTAIDALKPDSAPGPSETTPNMMKAWSPAIRRFIYNHMLNVWNHRLCPSWFKDKLIKLAPKIPGSNDLTHMRPISLYEVLRKVWTTTVAKRIHLIWHHRRLLNPAQYGYRLNNGILMPLYNLLNSIERAHCDGAHTLLTFWDIRRAFDSIPRSLQRLAWIRLGVPLTTAEWFVALDEGGHAYVTTPFYQTHSNLKSSREAHSDDTHFAQPHVNPSNPHPPLSFIPHRGIGQGESASSLMWVAVYDILLDWIDPANTTLHPASFQDLCTPTYLSQPLSQHELHTTDPPLSNAYADDLATISSGPLAFQIQQKQAEWISAFCAFTGLQINMSKIMPVSIGPLPRHHPTHLTVYNHLWEPTKCTILTNPQQLIYLGLSLDHFISGNSSAFHSYLLLQSTSQLEHLLDQPGTVPAKLDYIRFKILPTILHSAQCANWPLKWYRLLDKPFTKAYKTILILPKHFPTALLYLPSESGGVGLPRVSDRAQVMKWRAFHRSLAVGGHPFQAITAFLHRIPHDTAPHLPIRSLTLPPRWKPQLRLVARSLVEWLTQSGLALSQATHETPQQIITRHRNCISLQSVAQKIHLWPDPDIHDPDLPLLPLSFYVTDGSYRITTRTYADILTNEHSLRNQGTGAAGIVFISPARDRAPLPYTVRITTANPEPGLSAYAWELIAQVIAIRMTQHYPSTLCGYSDCTATIARINTALSSFIDLQPFVTAGILTSATHTQRSIQSPRQIQHVKAHPERDPHRMANLSPLDKAIFLADAVAGGTSARLGKEYINHDSFELILEDILTELIPVHAWHLRHLANMTIPVLDLPWTYQHQYQLQKYLSDRDTRSGAASDYWTSTAIDFMHAVHPLNSDYTSSYWHAARRATRTFDWIGHGRNQAKYLSQPNSSSMTLPPKPYPAHTVDNLMTTKPISC